MDDIKENLGTESLASEDRVVAAAESDDQTKDKETPASSVSRNPKFAAADALFSGGLANQEADTEEVEIRRASMPDLPVLRSRLAAAEPEVPPQVVAEKELDTAGYSVGEERTEVLERTISTEPIQPTDEAEAATANLPWFVVHTYSGYEMRAKLNLEERIRTHKMQSQFGKILVPQETVVELVRGQKKTSTRKFFPGYILVQMALTEDTWHLVKETPKITGFVGDSRNPFPLTPQEVANLTQQLEGGASKPRPRVHFEEGDAVKVIDGPFTDFNGTVDEVKPDKGKLRVLISIFGRNTPVELDFVQVEKA